jgi:hypothetical protein
MPRLAVLLCADIGCLARSPGSWSAVLSRSRERRLDLGSEQIRVQSFGIDLFEGVEAKPLPPRSRGLVQCGYDHGATGRLLVEFDGCGEDVRREGGPDAEVGVAAVDS